MFSTTTPIEYLEHKSLFLKLFYGVGEEKVKEDSEDEVSYHVCCGCGRTKFHGGVCECGGSHRELCEECGGRYDSDAPEEFREEELDEWFHLEPTWIEGLGWNHDLAVWEECEFRPEVSYPFSGMLDLRSGCVYEKEAVLSGSFKKGWGFLGEIEGVEDPDNRRMEAEENFYDSGDYHAPHNAVVVDGVEPDTAALWHPNGRA